MGKYEPTCAEALEICVLLQGADPPVELSGAPAVVSTVSRIARLDDLWIAERVAWAALKTVVMVNEQATERPLLASRILLGFQRYPSNPDEGFGPTGRSLKSYVGRIGRSDGRPSLTKTERQLIAAAEGNYGSRSQLSGQDRRLGELAEAVWAAMSDYVASLDAEALAELIFWIRVDGPFVRDVHDARTSPSVSVYRNGSALEGNAEDAPLTVRDAVARVAEVDRMEGLAPIEDKLSPLWWLVYFFVAGPTGAVNPDEQVYYVQKKARIVHRREDLSPSIYNEEIKRAKLGKRVAVQSYFRALPRRRRVSLLLHSVLVHLFVVAALSFPLLFGLMRSLGFGLE